MRKYLIFLLIFIIYADGYSFLRGAHFFVHHCHYASGQKVDDVMEIGLDAPFYSPGAMAIILCLYIVYIPAQFVEEMGHKVNLLPTACPWK